MCSAWFGWELAEGLEYKGEKYKEMYVCISVVYEYKIINGNSNWRKMTEVKKLQWYNKRLIVIPNGFAGNLVE